MKTPHPDAARWRKSSYSNGGDGNCVEVAEGVEGLAPVRDSKNPLRPPLAFPAAGWAAFISAVKRGDIAL